MEDPEKKKKRQQKNKIRKAVIKSVIQSAKTSLFPGKETRKFMRENKKYKKEIAKEFGLQKGGSVKSKNK